MCPASCSPCWRAQALCLCRCPTASCERGSISKFNYGRHGHLLKVAKNGVWRLCPLFEMQLTGTGVNIRSRASCSVCDSASSALPLCDLWTSSRDVPYLSHNKMREDRKLKVFTNEYLLAEYFGSVCSNHLLAYYKILFSTLMKFMIDSTRGDSGNFRHVKI